MTAATSTATRPLVPHLSRIPALDGIRGLAAWGIVLGHTLEHFNVLNGAAYNLDMFFVLSGYLITTLLIDEHEQTGGVRLRGFYWRRACRLIPALLVFVAVLWAFVLTHANQYVPGAVFMSVEIMKDNSLRLASQLFNWGMAFPDPARPTGWGMGPLWSLAVEEQFYLLWAPLSVVVLKHFGRVKLMTIAAVGAGLSMVWSLYLEMWVGAPAARIAFATDTQVSAVLIGALLAGLLRDARFRAVIARHGRAIAWTCALVMAAGFAGVFCLSNGPYRVPFVLATALAIGHLVVTGPGRAGRLLETWPFQWAGTRSYAIYCFNYPLVIHLPMSGLPAELGIPRWAAHALGALATGLVAEASFRFVERPALRQRHLIK